MDVSPAEIQMVEEINTAIAHLEQVLKMVPQQEQPKRPGRTSQVKHLEDLEARLRVLQNGNADERSKRQAAGAWESLQAATWELAASADHIAIREARRIRTVGLEMDDLVQEARLGCMRAARRYDPARGVRFTAFARWWARAQLLRAINRGSRLVRTPEGTAQKVRQLQHIIDDHEGTGKRVDFNTAAAEVGLAPEVARIYMVQAGAQQIDDGLTEDGGSLVEDQLTSDARAPDEVANDVLAYEKVTHLLTEVLDDRQLKVVREAYGVEGVSPRAMISIGDDLGVSRERVRQIRVEAVGRLRDAMQAA